MPPELPGQAQNGQQSGELVGRSKEAKKPPVEAIYLNVICGGFLLEKPILHFNKLDDVKSIS